MDDAICIRVWDWSETSQTVSLFCRSLGVIRGLAKGAKRQDARFSGGYELFTRGQAGVLQKSQDALATLTAWDLTELFPGARRDLPRFFAAMAMLDLTNSMIRDRDPHPVMFDALIRAGRRLASQGAGEPREALLAYLWATLVECGYRLELFRDVRQEQDLDVGNVQVFVPALGGFSSRVEHGEQAWRVRPQTLRVLRGLETPGVDLEDGEAVGRSLGLLCAYVREVLGQPVPSLEQAVNEFRKNP